ncbi:MAG TPA: hypothetical protein DCS05_00240, partial [Nitrospiraceae bacterium]|nr:hypothetical protein [Nitrospiraceae bacterium]
MFSLRRPGVRARRKIALLEIDYDAVLSKILARGGDFADLYVEQGEPFSILCEEDRIEKVVSGRDWGVGVRLVTGGKTAYAYTNDLTTASLNELAEAVGRAAAASKDPSCVPMLNLTRK